MPASIAGADVVDVDVDVPQAVPADHDEGVAEAASRLRRSGIAASSASRRYITS